jgi:hypothetical protein
MERSGSLFSKVDTIKYKGSVSKLTGTDAQWNNTGDVGGFKESGVADLGV